MSEAAAPLRTFEITVQVRTVYGVDLVYPVCDKARTFARLAGTTTLTRRSLEIIKDAGWLVREV